MSNLHDFNANTIRGDDCALEGFAGKVCLVVNVASECGLTPQYEGLQRLYDEYRAQGLEILGFPCNQFALQEPGTNEEIKEFCETNYGITFEIFNKIKVNGSKADPLYSFLKKEKPGVAGTSQIKWNFTKFLIDKNGKVVKRFSPQVESDEIESCLKKIL